MAGSMQDYLKKYNATTTTRGDDEITVKPKKKKKGKEALNKLLGKGVVIVDDDGVWQKEGKPEEEAEDEGDKPTVIEEVDVKVMQRMEALKSYRPYLSVANDGSGWVTVKGDGEGSTEGRDANSEGPTRSDSGNLFPQTERHHTPDMSRPSRRTDADLSPTRKKVRSRNDDGDEFTPPRTRRDSPNLSPPRRRNDADVSPPRKFTSRNGDRDDLSSFRKRGDSPDMSPPRRRRDKDLSPPRKKVRSKYEDGDDGSSPPKRHDSPDMSPPRRRKYDLSPPRRKVTSSNADSDRYDRGERGDPSLRKRHDSSDLSPPRRKDLDSSPPRKKATSKNKDVDDDKSTKLHKMSDGSAGGLRTDKQVAEEIQRKKAVEFKALAELDPSVSGRGAETVYRDKRGRRLEGLEELLRQQKGEAKPVEKPLEWGKGLAQKRDMEAKFAELEAERNKPFARTRDDPELDKELRDTVRWGDPMAHLVKKKLPEPVLPDLGASEEMKASGFIVPQDIPPHSWLKRGIAPPANRYGIKPGRHWDGVDRSTGYERDMFKAKNEKHALEREAYLWSVSDM